MAVSENLVAQRIMLFNMLLLFALTVSGWLFYNWFFARSILFGGLLTTASFWLLKTDIQSLMRRLSNMEQGQQVRTGMEKARFFLKFYARLSVFALVLLVLIAKIPINMIGLLLGLSTTMVSVVIIGLSMGKNWTPNKA